MMFVAKPVAAETYTGSNKCERDNDADLRHSFGLVLEDCGVYDVEGLIPLVKSQLVSFGSLETAGKIASFRVHCVSTVVFT